MSFGNVSAARAAQEAAQRNNFQDDTWKYELGLIADETVIVRFVGGPTEPYIYDTHGFSNNGGGFDRHRCLAPAPCRACALASVRGEKRVKKASGNAAFTVYSTRPCFQIPKTSQGGKNYVQSEPIRLDVNNQPIYRDKNSGNTLRYPNGQHPMNGQYPWAEEGLKIWSGSLAPIAHNADEIITLDQSLKVRCQCSRTVQDGLMMKYAEVRLGGHVCAACGTQVVYEPTSGPTVTCMACRHNAPPRELLQCTAGCENPKRGGLSECYVRITRTGTGNATTYKFEPMPFGPVTPQHLAAMFSENNGVQVPNVFKYDEIYPKHAGALEAALVARGFPPAGAQQPQQPGQFQGGQFGGFTNTLPSPFSAGGQAPAPMPMPGGFAPPTPSPITQQAPMPQQQTPPPQQIPMPMGQAAPAATPPPPVVGFSIKRD